MSFFKTQQPQSLTYLQFQDSQGIKYLELQAGAAKHGKQKQITIGRTHDNTVQILDNTISKKHAKIVFLTNHHYLTDLDSVNGVLINGKKIKKGTSIILDHEDKIQFGKYEQLYQYRDIRKTKGGVRGKSRNKINLKDYVFDEQVIEKPQKKQNKIDLVSQPETQKNWPKKQKRKVKESKIKIPDFTDFLSLEPLQREQKIDKVKPQKQKEQPLDNKTFIRSPGISRPKQGRIKLTSLGDDNMLSESDVQKHKLSQRQRNIYQQQQQIKQQLEQKQKAIKQNELKMQIQRAKQAQDLLQRQLILSQKVKQEKQSLQKERERLQEEFVQKQKQKREIEMQKIKQMQLKQIQMMKSIEQEKQQQLNELQEKQQKFKQESQMQYRAQYEKRKKQLEIQAAALAQNYQRIYRETIQKVRTEIDNEEETIRKMEEKQNTLIEDNQSLENSIQMIREKIAQVKKQYIQIHGRNRAYVLYASELQDKIDGLAIQQENNNKNDGYYHSFDGAGSANTKKIQQSILNSRKLLKIKRNQYQTLFQETIAVRGLLREQNYTSGIVQDVNDYLDTITSNMQEIQKLKQEYLEQIETQKGIEDLWEVQLEEYSQYFQRNSVLQADTSRNARQIDQNTRDQIKKSTEQRLHLLKAMHFCSEQKKSAARFLIEQMLNIEQENHKYLVENQEYHQIIVKTIKESEKKKRQNQLLSQILFGQDENGHHFDNMKTVINNLIERLQQEKAGSNILNCIKLTQEGFKLQLSIQEETEKKRRIRQSLRKIGQMGLAPQQVKNLEKNPMVFFGDLLTNKQLEVDQKKLVIQDVANSNTMLREQIKLLEEKRKKISESLEKFKRQQLLEAKKYLSQ